MPELQQLFYRHCKYILYLMSLFILGWGFTDYKTMFMGLFFGTCFSLYNHWNLYRKTNKVAKAVEQEKRVYFMGTLVRMAAAILAVFIAMRFPEVFHLTGVIIGLVTAPAVIMIDFFIETFLKAQKKREER